MAGRPTVSVIIPTLNAAGEIGPLLESLGSQTVRPDEVLVVDSSSDDGTVEIVCAHLGVRLETIRREDFDHGGTRDNALGMTSGDLVLFLTQDALPADASYIENLIAPFSDPQIALSYGRQLPKPGAKRYVQLVQEFNYPASSAVRTISDIGRLGIKAFFCSDTCSAYRRIALECIGGIPHPCQTNEDMLSACRLLRAGFSVAYVADAQVLHSHNLSLKQQFNRNYAIGQFLAKYASELDVPSETNEGKKLACFVVRRLISEMNLIELIIFFMDCVSRLFGNRFGKAANKGSE